MKTRTFLVIWIFAAMLATFASNAAEKPTDPVGKQVAASFERDLNREATQPTTATGDDIDDDVLYERIAKPLQSPDSNEATDKESQS